MYTRAIQYHRGLKSIQGLRISRAEISPADGLLLGFTPPLDKLLVQGNNYLLNYQIFFLVNELKANKIIPPKWVCWSKEFFCALRNHNNKLPKWNLLTNKSYQTFRMHDRQNSSALKCPFLYDEKSNEKWEHWGYLLLTGMTCVINRCSIYRWNLFCPIGIRYSSSAPFDFQMMFIKSAAQNFLHLFMTISV